MKTHPGLIAGAPFLAEPGLQRILSLLNAEGEQARVVGGAVRNTLMGRAVSDIDIATTALPEAVMARAAAIGIHAVPTGVEHGTVTLVVGGVAYEVTTLREDIDTDGRHAKVRFGRDFARDALRRDFTINALFADPLGNVFDYAGGLADLTARRVRFIGDADARIREDYLRILRLFRFSAAYGDGTIDPEGLRAARRGMEGIERLSRERIRQETLKLLVQPNTTLVLAIMAREGFAAPILGGPVDLARLDRLVAIESTLAEQPDAIRRLFALAVADPQDAHRLRERLRLSNAEADRLAAMTQAKAAGTTDRTLLYLLGPDAYRDRIIADWLARAATADDPARLAAYHLPEHWSAPRFPLSGADLIASGWKPGPELGAELRRLEAEWIAAGMPPGD